uniref:Ig-like domain-containing protein n=1 Tax=Cyprinus carpio TaxID=7962 RepID=A0A8C1VST2_CYPCA
MYCLQLNYHEFWLIEAYGDSDQEDDEHVAHVDFKEQKEIITLPDFAGQIELPSLYEDAKKGVSICRTFFDMLKQFLLPKETDTITLTTVDVILNTLVCLVSGFFPPPVRVLWIKNNVKVKDQSALSRDYPNKDGTLNLFSQLSFIPEEGDIYSCFVKHKALQLISQIFVSVCSDVEITEPSTGPSVFCGVGLALGLLGLATGAVFIAKGETWI